MGRIHERFELLKERDERALVVFLSAGDPDLDATEALVLAMAESGADVIEIGVPFSDPVADGPKIQASSERGRKSGATLQRILQRVERLRPKLEQPLVLMGYTNPFLALGAERFAALGREVGIDGVIVPDLPPEEGADFFRTIDEAGIDGILLAAPTTTEERLELLADRSRGFLYYVSLSGVTGAHNELADGLAARVALAKSYGDLPVCVGFGISTAEHAKAVGEFADGVVVGSAIVDRIEAASSVEAAVDSVAQFVSELKGALKSG
jgi:tryptophan synthase alpha chain